MGIQVLGHCRLWVCSSYLSRLNKPKEFVQVLLINLRGTCDTRGCAAKAALENGSSGEMGGSTSSEWSHFGTLIFIHFELYKASWPVCLAKQIIAHAITNQPVDHVHHCPHFVACQNDLYPTLQGLVHRTRILRALPCVSAYRSSFENSWLALFRSRSF